MLILSFRDMSTPRCSAVTSAAMYSLDPLTAATSWVPPPSLQLVSWSDVAQALAGKHVCFVVHGFNVDRDRGYTGFGAAAQEMAPGGALTTLIAPIGPMNLSVPGVDIVIPVLWAGDWYLPINYPFLLPDVRLTGRYFAEFIASSATQMARVSFVTHSMGARVVLETVQQAAITAQKTGARMPVFDTAVLTAAAASDEVLDDPDYEAAVTAIQQFVVVSSRSDTVLSGWFPAGNLVEQALWWRDPGADDALGRYGPRLKVGSKALTKTRWFPIPPAVQQNHEDYFPEPWNAAPAFPNGWSDKRIKIGELDQAVLDSQTPAFPAAATITPIAAQ